MRRSGTVGFMDLFTVLHTNLRFLRTVPAAGHARCDEAARSMLQPCEGHWPSCVVTIVQLISLRPEPCPVNSLGTKCCPNHVPCACTGSTKYATINYACEVQGCHSGDSEVNRLLGCDVEESWLNCRRFTGTYCLHLQGRNHRIHTT
jgi:hypothetical protein